MSWRATFAETDTGVREALRRFDVVRILIEDEIYWRRNFTSWRSRVAAEPRRPAHIADWSVFWEGPDGRQVFGYTNSDHERWRTPMASVWFRVWLLQFMKSLKPADSLF